MNLSGLQDTVFVAREIIDLSLLVFSQAAKKLLRRAIWESIKLN